GPTIAHDVLAVGGHGDALEQRFGGVLALHVRRQAEQTTPAIGIGPRLDGMEPDGALEMQVVRGLVVFRRLVWAFALALALALLAVAQLVVGSVIGFVASADRKAERTG